MEDILAMLTLASDVFLAAVLLTWIASKLIRKPFAQTFPKNFYVFLYKNRFYLAFAVALVAMTGSLYYSEIKGLEPCKLCWYQRILMYPLVLIIGTALAHKDELIKRYVTPLAIIGVVIASYHYYIQVLGKSIIPCALGDPCTKIPFIVYGYITIPMMALTAFLLILFLVNLKFTKELK